MKYIIFRVVDGGVERELPVLFPDALIHAQVAKVLTGLMADAHAHLESMPRPIAAGQVRLDAVICTGESETLGLLSRGTKDKRLIENFDLNKGWL
jgi:hypothetical protein